MRELKKYSTEAEALYQILHFIYDMLGRETLQGILFEYNVRVHMRKHADSSLKFNKKVATVGIVIFNGLLVIGTLSLMQKMNIMIFSHMLCTSLFFVILMDACIDLVTCYLLDFALYDTVYPAVIHIKHRLEEHARDLVNAKLKWNEIHRNADKKGRGNSSSGNIVDTNTLKEYVNGFSASRHFFVSYKNMLEYKEDSIEKAYILSYTNPVPGHVNQWSQVKYDDVFMILQKYSVCTLAVLLKLPRTVHYLLLYTLLIVLLTIALGASHRTFSSAPYVILVCIFIILWIILSSVYKSSLDFSEVRPSSADTDDDDKESNLLDGQLSEGEQEEMIREMEHRITHSLNKERCFSCKESDPDMLHLFEPIKSSVGNQAIERSKICTRCANTVCQGCCKSDTPTILRLNRGDGCTVCVYCVDNVCRKCKTFYLFKEITLRHSKHGRTTCTKCYLMEKLQKSSTEKIEENRLRMIQLLKGSGERKIAENSIGHHNIS